MPACIQCCKSGLAIIFLPTSDDKGWILVESASWSQDQTAIGSSAKSPLSGTILTQDWMRKKSPSIYTKTSWGKGDTKGWVKWIVGVMSCDVRLQVYFFSDINRSLG